MRCPRFYCPDLSAHSGSMLLPDSVFRHAIQVLRLKVGASLRLFDGQGLEYLATVTDIQRREASVELGERLEQHSESPLNITLLQGISRGERMDYAIQKAVELGVKQIQPIITERCNVPMDASRAAKRQQHWQGVITSACEQSGRNVLPALLPVTDLTAALTIQADHKLVLDPQATQNIGQLSAQQNVVLLIGPEGGLTDSEITLAVEQQFTAIRFGPRILRTETASAAALAVLQAMWGDLK